MMWKDEVNKAEREAKTERMHGQRDEDTQPQHTAALMGEEEEMSDRELRGKVLVGGRSHEISVYRKSKSVWIAVGDYIGVTITVQDRSEGANQKAFDEYQAQSGGPELHVAFTAMRAAARGLLVKIMDVDERE